MLLSAAASTTGLVTLYTTTIGVSTLLRLWEAARLRLTRRR
jgi:hypothetical protein